MKKKRKVLGVTGIRSEYDIMSSVYSAIQGHSHLDLELIVTGAHLSYNYGNTIREITKDGFRVSDCIESLLNSNSASSRVKGLGIQLQGIIQAIERIQPDFLLVLGDREEAMSTALAGAYMNIPVAHVAGGDRVVGNVDDQVRHAVSRLAHLHFTTNQESADRLLRMGEQKFRVVNVGNPGLDRFLTVPMMTRSEISEKIKFEISEKESLILLIQHVISTEIDDAYRQMKITLDAVKEMKEKTVIIYPNSDAGSQQIIKAIQEINNCPFIYISKNLERNLFVNIMRHASCMVGNSSAGIMEAPFLKVPVINIGNRQKKRLHSENIEFVPHHKEAILRSVRKALFDSKYKEKVKRCKSLYGDGRASEKIVKKLSSVSIDRKLLIKDITY